MRLNAPVQGLEDNLERFMKSPVMHVAFPRGFNLSHLKRCYQDHSVVRGLWNAWALLRPSPREGGARYVFHVAGPINRSYVLIPPPRTTSLKAGLLQRDTVGILLCDWAWHYDINGSQFLESAGRGRWR